MLGRHSPRLATWLAAGLLLATASAPRPSYGALTLTTAGSNAGFTLSTVAYGFDSLAGLGPLGIAFPTANSMLVADFAGEVYAFSSIPSNTPASSATVAQNLGGNGPIGMTVANGQVYLADRAHGTVDAISVTGAFQSFVVSVSNPTGLATNPVTGRVYVSSNTNGIYEINPSTQTKTLIISGAGFDGLSVSPDGKTIYAAQGTGIQVYSTGVNGAPSPALQATYAIGDSTDGTALGTGSLAGNLFVNTNSGNLWEYNIGTSALTLIASGGSRGDFVAVAPNGDLFVTQGDSILSLSAPPGGGFTGTTDVPEPAGLSILGIALAGLAVRRFRSA